MDKSNAQLPLKIRGALGSPYSLKMRAVLRYRHIPFKWVPQGSKWDDLPPFPLIPVIAFPDDAGNFYQRSWIAGDGTFYWGQFGRLSPQCNGLAYDKTISYLRPVDATGATVGGTTTVTAHNGVAAFTNLKFNGASGASYKLYFASADMGKSVKSADISLATGALDHFAVTASNAGANVVAGGYVTVSAQAKPVDVNFTLDFIALGRRAPWYVALAKGYYKEFGLDVTLKPGGPDITPEQVVASGQAQFGVDWLPSLLAARDKGTDLVNVAQVFARSGMTQLTWKSSGITSVAGMKA